MSKKSLNESGKISKREYDLIAKHSLKQHRLQSYVLRLFNFSKGLGTHGYKRKTYTTALTLKQINTRNQKAQLKRERVMRRNIIVEVLKAGNYNGV